MKNIIELTLFGCYSPKQFRNNVEATIFRVGYHYPNAKTDTAVKSSTKCGPTFIVYG